MLHNIAMLIVKFCYNKFCIEICQGRRFFDKQKNFAITNFVLKFSIDANTTTGWDNFAITNFVLKYVPLLITH